MKKLLVILLLAACGERINAMTDVEAEQYATELEQEMLKHQAQEAESAFQRKMSQLERAEALAKALVGPRDEERYEEILKSNPDVIRKRIDQARTNIAVLRGQGPAGAGQLPMATQHLQDLQMIAEVLNVRV